MTTVAVLGASGYAGAEFLRLAHLHPDLKVAAAFADTQAGTAVRDLYPNLSSAYPDLVFQPFDADLARSCDVVVSGLPHRSSGEIVAGLVDDLVVLDLSADFRLRDPAVYEQWYGVAAPAQELIDRFVYGLPELHRDRISATRAVAVPGCYPTTAILALHPFVSAGMVEPDGIIVDAASGVSGAGRPPKPNTTFCAADEDFTAYGLLTHRHTPEIEQETGTTVLFTPHLAPMSRGILATCYLRPVAPLTTAEAMATLTEAYADEPFVVVTDQPPSTKATMGTNCAHLTARVDPRTGYLMVLCALDNLVKGTSGQAIQCLNLVMGLPETTGLPTVGLLP